MTAFSSFTTWCFAFLLFLSPPAARGKWQERMGDRVPVAQRETRIEGEARYLSIASDFTEVVFAPDFVPLFPGKHGRARTVALGSAVAHTESGLRVDVDFGLGKEGMGDNGRSFCLFQIQTGKTGIVPVGNETMRTWKGRDLVTDRKKCIRAGFEMIRMSLAACRHLENPRDHLSAYTTGSCRDNEPESRRKIDLAARILRIGKLPDETSPPVDGSAVQAAAHASP